jgi:hypothetical protein
VEGKLPSEMYEGPVKVSFKTHLFAAAAPVGSHALAALFAAASMAESAITGGKKYTLAVAADGATPSVCFYFYHGGRFYKALGCCGSLKVNAKAGELFELEWEFTGRWAATDVTDTAFPSLASMPTIGAPVRFVSATMTMTRVPDGVSYPATVMAAANSVVDFGQKVIGVKDPAAVDGVARYWVESFETKASIDPQTAALADFNPFTAAGWKHMWQLDVDVVVATVHHHIIVTYMQLLWPKPGERDGLQTYALEAVGRAADEAAGYVASIQFNT